MPPPNDAPAAPRRTVALDGLRGIAILLVILFHLPTETLGLPVRAAMPGGFLGVTLFFALSGFLITDLLLREHARTGSVDRHAFYLRRVARLGPALLVFLGTTTLLAAAGTVPGWGDPRSWLRVWLAAGTLTSNWWETIDYHIFPAGTAMLWSLAVEEQFYLLWPSLLLALLAAGYTLTTGRRSLLRASALGVACCWMLTLAIAGLAATGHAPTPLAYFATWVHLPVLLLGAAAAAVYRSGWSVPRASAWALPMLALLWLTARDWPATTAAMAVLSAGTLSAVTVLSTASGRQGRYGLLLLEHPALRWCGRRSYAMYLWNTCVFFVVGALLPPTWWALALAVLAIGILAEASWWLVERPINRWAHARYSR